MNRLRSPEIWTFAALLVVLGPLLPLNEGASWWVQALCAAVAIAFTLEASDLIAAALVSPRDLPRLESLNYAPRVAILYLVCDDLVPVALERLGTTTYPAADIFILDDSQDPVVRRQIDETGWRIVRRVARNGNKAGSINHWLGIYGTDYDYFLLLDSDSVGTPEFLHELLLYAEHPRNISVAIFNPLMCCWNGGRRFPHVLSTLTPLKNWVRLRLANRSVAILSVGHNNLHRTSAITRVGGFDEHFIAEDVAITLRLVRAGYTSRLVGVESYEAEPDDVLAYVARLARWSSQTLQVLRADWTGVPLALRFQIFRNVWFYCGFLLAAIWPLLLTWVPEPLRSVSSNMTSEPGGANNHAPFASLLLGLAIQVGFGLMKFPIMIKAGIRVRDGLLSATLFSALGLHAMVAVSSALVFALLSPTLGFNVTKKRLRSLTPRMMLFAAWPNFVFVVVVAAGLMWNPEALTAFTVWLALFLAAPILLLAFRSEPISGIP
jgi:cellulose synthase/poly-beta-1,6-N-acetylglucosamine synthase-like glycosyltransferase